MAYKVKRPFTDRKGKARKPGEPFEGSPEEIDGELASGNIEEVISPPPGKPGGGQGGGAPA
jgi:hypothetical protein